MNVFAVIVLIVIVLIVIVSLAWIKGVSGTKVMLFGINITLAGGILILPDDTSGMGLLLLLCGVIISMIGLGMKA